MPNYVYVCPKCGATRERQRLISERDGCTLCHRCYHEGDVLMTRVPGAPGFTLKGKGFHCNDYPKR